jgi:putative SOS response-associated peptidase YedK
MFDPLWRMLRTDIVARATSRSPDAGERSLDAFPWGLIPPWAKDAKIGYRSINARSETVDKTRRWIAPKSVVLTPYAPILIVNLGRG